jgi:putative transposase
MKKLGYHVSESYVRDILKKNGIPPSGQRKGLSWKQFILSHMDIMWATDFFTEEVWTRAGLVTCYVLFFIHLGTRRIHVAGCTPNPKYAWVSLQARNFSMLLDDKQKDRCKYIIHDRDSCFHALDAVLSVEDIEIVKTPPRAPMCNAYAERFVREARETLDNMILFGESHLSHVCKKIEKYHNKYRPHQGLGNMIPLRFDYPRKPTSLKSIQCKETLGGLLNHYYAEKQAA